jgi:NAD(P)-dependent dehydrogenase (short-subunit alcohol dehydrogenase family)
MENRTNKKFKNFDLNGKTALITGAAGLLGVEHAIALLESGATVVLTDISKNILISVEKKLSEKVNKNRIILYKMDVTNLEEITHVYKDLTSNGVYVDILINNAAIDPKVKDGDKLLESSRLENFSMNQWDLEVSVGLKGAFLCSQVFGSKMASDKKGGVILNIASDLSIFSPDQRLYRKEGILENLQPVKPITYSVIKSGLIGLTKYLSTYWSDKGVRCNALSPGGVYNGQDDKFINKLSELIPLGRMANKDEYHSAVQFLCSDASSYMNGQNVVMDGGRSTW